MAIEFFRPSIAETGNFLDKIGFPRARFDLIRTYSGVFKDRRVVKATDTHNGATVVLKARRNDAMGLREWANLQTIMSSYRFAGTHFNGPDMIELQEYLVYVMPFLGHDLSELAETLNLHEYGYPPTDETLVFNGFTPDHIDTLMTHLQTSHSTFACKYGLIHGDMWHNGPNNILYHPGSDKLFLIDAEALNTMNGEREYRFYDQTEKVREWLHASLAV